MLIELGPRPRLLRGLDWHVMCIGNADGLHRCVVAEQHGYFWYGLQPASVLHAALVYGFDVAADGRILNWDDVPHLCEPTCDVD